MLFVVLFHPSTNLCLNIHYEPRFGFKLDVFVYIVNFDLAQAIGMWERSDRRRESRKLKVKQLGMGLNKKIYCWDNKSPCGDESGLQ